MTRPRSSTLQSSILDEARRVLVAEGYSHLSMRRIAAAVGCTATSIYLYYRNKDALIHALIDEGMELLQEQLERSALPADEPLERMRALCRAYLEFGLENPEYYEVMFMLHPERMDRYPAEKYRRARRNLEIFSETLGAIHSGDAAERPDLKVLTTVLWFSLHGAVTLMNARRIDVSIDRKELLDQAVSHSLQIAARPSPSQMTSSPIQ